MSRSEITHQIRALLLEELERLLAVGRKEQLHLLVAKGRIFGENVIQNSTGVPVVFSDEDLQCHGTS